MARVWQGKDCGPHGGNVLMVGTSKSSSVAKAKTSFGFWETFCLILGNFLVPYITANIYTTVRMNIGGRGPHHLMNSVNYVTVI